MISLKCYCYNVGVSCGGCREESGGAGRESIGGGVVPSRADRERGHEDREGDAGRPRVS